LQQLQHPCPSLATRPSNTTNKERDGKATTAPGLFAPRPSQRGGRGGGLAAERRILRTIQGFLAEDLLELCERLEVYLARISRSNTKPTDVSQSYPVPPYLNHTDARQYYRFFSLEPRPPPPPPPPPVERTLGSQ